MDAYISDIAVMSYLHVHSNGHVPDDPHGDNGQYNGVYTPEQWLKIVMTCTNFIDGVTWGKLFKKSMFDSIRFPINIKLCENVLTIWKTYLRANRIAFYNNRKFIYQDNSGSLTRKQLHLEKEMQMHLAKIKAWEDRISLMTMLNMDMSYMQDNYVQLLGKIAGESLKVGDNDTYHQVMTKIKIIQNLT